VLFAIGLALLLISFLLYPRTAELPSPAFSRLALSAGFRVAFIDYSVIQVSPATRRSRSQLCCQPARQRRPPMLRPRF